MARRLVILLLVLLPAAAALAEKDPARWVDPFIGTGGHGHTYPGATLPFGMVQLSPDTRLEGWDGCSGYHDDDSVVYGFSHTHLSGTGISDYGDILFMPVAGRPNTRSGYGASPDAGYASRFDKSSERAVPGHYSVELKDYNIAVDLTATERAGFHRYRFPAGRPAHVVIDLVHRDEVRDSELRLVGTDGIEGYRRSTGWAKDQFVYFAAQFSRPIGEAFLIKNDEARPGKQKLRGKNIKALLSFDGDVRELLVKVGISAVDVEGARRNLEAEIPDWNFERVRSAARKSWNEALGRIAVSGGSEDERTIFYTGLYHSMLAPNVYSDVDLRYRGMDGQIHRTDGRRHYTVFSLWDTFRATHPLLALIETKRTQEFIETFLEQYRQNGRLPVWELAGNETDTMIGYHAVPVIVDAWVKGIRGFREALALKAMVDGAGMDHFGLEAYRRQGFIGVGDFPESVSRTLEYAYDDACIAKMAGGLGLEEIAEEFNRRAQGWRHLFDPETGFMRARRNQSWLESFDPYQVDNNYTEANAWQYSFFVPQDLEGLIAALGGEERFVERLDALFEAGTETTGRVQADITGLIGQYAHGNEPSHHMAWLYHYAGRPDRSADRVREILDTLYAAAPDGLSGNEDCGQMSSWYVLSAIGLYPVSPCSDEYTLGAPLFDRVTIKPDTGTSFSIRAKGASSARRYIQSAKLGGKPLERSFLRHDEIASGGSLVLSVGDRPASDWGRAPEARPMTRIEGPRVLAAPTVRGLGERFRGEATVELLSAEPGAEIHYKIQPSPPGVEWQVYREPILLETSAFVQLYAQRGEDKSPVVSALFHRVPNDWTIEIAGEPNPRYTAGGPDALIDGIAGDEDWRTGGWQGYQGTDFEATVDLGEARPLTIVGASFLQDMRSWIWMPTEVVISVSNDGETFQEIGRVEGGIAGDEEGILYSDYVLEYDGIEARWVRILAKSYGTIPDWHPGRGHPSYIFIDEILIR